MKKFLFYALLVTLIASCKNNNNGQKNKETNNSSANAETQEVTKRDYSINPSNSYSDLFLDSSAVENFIETKQINDILAQRIRSFYNARNYQFAWFNSDGVTEQGRSFWNLHQYYNTSSDDTTLLDKELKKKMNVLVSIDTLSVKATNKSIINTEISLSQHLLQYVTNNYKDGEIEQKEVERFVPYKKEDALQVANSLLTKKHKDNKYYGDVNKSYKLLQEQLKKYYDIAKNGAWPTIITNQKKIKLGSTSPAVLTIKKRLQITGELPAGDTSATFDQNLANAVKTFQTSRGLTADGVVTAALIKEMNVPTLKRVEQLLINMGRMHWMLNAQEGGNLIVVNIPEFVLHAYEGKEKKFDMNVVVGKEGHNTTIFTGNLNQVVFSPYWNLTPNIVESEILPAIQKDPDYLTKNNMEEVGSPVDGIPVVRQLPGEKNSLGKVKFLFPNSFDIYFHDTPAKELFNRDKRAYSHGCIRLSDPEKMAAYVLRDQPEWTPEKIEEAMNSGQEQFVKVKNPVPVLITYYTAWVDDNGVLNFRDDIYSHDSYLAQKMFTNPL